MKHIILALLLFSSPLSASADQGVADQKEALLPVGDYPGGETSYVTVGSSPAQADPSWAVRTGIKKGVLDQTLDEELFAGPDTAILKGGFFEQWGGLLAKFDEPFRAIEPWDLGGLHKTKPLLIIPTNGLYGLTDSDFFKAGLAEYVRAGGTVLCFAQQNGADFAALPAPVGRKLEAVGWAQDFGAMFRASTIQDSHPVLASMKKSTPSLETDGYFMAYPLEATILLSRADGYPTALVYPFGSGWVVLTSLFSDFSFNQGLLHDEEKALIRDMITWAKAPGQVHQVSPGDALAMNLTIIGPEQGEASSVKIFILGQNPDKPRSEQVLPLTIASGQAITLPFSYVVPPDTQPGIHHIEYLLLDQTGRKISALAEASEGRFSIKQTVSPSVIPLSKLPLSAVPLKLSIEPKVGLVNDNVRVGLEISRASGSAAQDLFVRMAGQEKSFRLSTDKTVVSFDVSRKDAGSVLAYAIHHANGRSLLRGIIPVVVPQKKGISLDKPYYLPGQRAKVAVSGMGNGEFSLSGLGFLGNRMMTEMGDMELNVPTALPAGTYPVEWEFQPISAPASRGELPILVMGYRAKFINASLEKAIDHETYKMTAAFKVNASQKISAQLKLWLRDPDGTVTPVGESAVALAQGEQEIPFKFSFNPKQAGIAQLTYGLFVTLPEGAGFSTDPQLIAAGRKCFDAGEIAVLGATFDRPVYYKPSGVVEASAHIVGKGKTKIELFLDNKRFTKEKVDVSGPYTFTSALPQLSPGQHTLRVTTTGSSLDSAREQRFTYGARLPDLIAAIKTSAPANGAMLISIVIRNQGKSASPVSSCALYEGDPAKSGLLLSKAAVPAIEPGEQKVLSTTWPLRTKAGARTLTAVVDANNAIAESNDNNNTCVEQVLVPDFLLSLLPVKNSYTSDEAIAFTASIMNLTGTAYSNAVLDLQIVDPAGKTVSAEGVPLAKLAPSEEKKISRNISLVAPPAGVYQILARLSKDKPLSSDTATVTMLPTLLLQGSLDKTPTTAATCRPFAIRYSVQNIGNVPVTNGALKVELKATASNQPIFSQQLPFTMEAKDVAIDNLEFPQGAYTVILKATAMNLQHNVAGEFTLAEQQLIVSGPVDVKAFGASLPRVLIWEGASDIPVEQAAADNILKQAFEHEGIYSRIVDSEKSFMEQLTTGLFNTYVLFETNEMIGKPELLRQRLELGEGLIIMGAGERSRATAEQFGFRFSGPQADNGTMITFTDDSGLGLSGTVPVSGSLFSPQKKGSKTAALFANTKQPACLIDAIDTGKIMVLPMSLAKSAIDTGTTSLYGLIVRAAALSVAPEHDRPGTAITSGLSISSTTGPVKTKIVTTVPVGWKVIPITGEGLVKDNTITYELTADKGPVELMRLIQPSATGAGNPVTEVFYECEGKYVNQGKVE